MKQALLTALLLSSLATVAQAQSQYPPDRVFSYYDRDKNGRLDGREYERFSEEMREAVRAARLDFRRGVDKNTFIRAWPRITEEMRAIRDRNASRGGGDRGDGRGPSNYRRDDGRRDDGRRDDSKSKPKSKRPPKRKPQPRITVDLPSSFAEIDKNKDGQVGLYEWDRAKYREFFALDKNGDGILTPRELSSPTSARPSTRTSSTSSSGSTAKTETKPAESKPEASTITPVKFDPESSDGRRASYVFRALDRNKDGTLTQEEWERSQSTRRDFERKNVKPTLPAKLEDFAGIYIAVRQAR